VAQHAAPDIAVILSRPRLAKDLTCFAATSRSLIGFSAMFVDEAKNLRKSRRRRQGPGCVAFRRENTFRARTCRRRWRTRRAASTGSQSQRQHAAAVRYNREFKADRGRHGEGSNCSGQAGDDMTLLVPVGTVAYEQHGTNPSPISRNPASVF